MNPVYVFGDSIGQGIFLREDSWRYQRSRRSCIQLLKESGLPIESRAVMGCTIERGLAFFRNMETEPGGFCVIEFGGNDCDLDWQAVSDHPEQFHDGKVPLARFAENLRTFVAEARRRELQPVLVTPPPILSRRYYDWVCQNRNPEHILRYLGDVEHISRWQERYVNAIREVAAQEKCTLLDLRADWLEEMDLPSLMSMDGIHPNEAGYQAMAEYVRQALEGSPVAV